MRPNIIVFFSDDHAQWALPCYGNREILSPSLDYLAETGIVMQNAFTPCPVCSPARASFWTGLYPSQHGIHDHLAEDDAAVQATDWLAGQYTLADALKSAGYTTALCGKWHCGSGEKPRRGFDFWHSAWRKTPKYHSRTNLYSEQGRLVKRSGTDTRIISEAAVHFLRARAADMPFFLFVGYAATHNPWINRPERLVSQYRSATFRDIPADIPYPFGEKGTHPLAPEDPREAWAQYYASVSMIDEGIGLVLDELAAQEQSENTLIVYTSDHGLNMGHHGLWGKGNGSQPLNMLEESIRVPLILNCPAELDGGCSCGEFVTHCDLHETLLDCARIPRADDDARPGGSYKARLLGVAEGEWDNVYIGEYGTTRAIRDQRHKLVLRAAEGANLLHDLGEDPRETRNLYDDPNCQAIIADMTGRLNDFFDRYAKPEHSGLRGDALPIHNRHEAWRTVGQAKREEEI